MLLLAAIVLISSSFAQTTSPARTVTLPLTLDHNRIIIDVNLPLADGTTKRVRAWVDNGNPELWMTENVAKLLGLDLSGPPVEGQGMTVRIAAAPASVRLGDMSVSMTPAQNAHVLLARESVAPGVSAEITLPSTVLRNYDVWVNYPDREFTLGVPGSLQFKGVTSKGIVNPDNGLLQVPAKIEGKNYNLALDLGASVGFLSGELIDQWLHAHPAWPHMTGGTGIANLWGTDDEAQMKLLRLLSLQFGPVVLTNAVFGAFDAKVMEWYQERAGVKTAGLVGANALLNYRVGLDYKNQTVYLDLRNFYKPNDMDVIGLVLRPEPDGHYTVIGIAHYDGKPSVPGVEPGDVLISADGIRATGATMGQVWSSLEGKPGQVRELMLERDGKQVEVKATVRRFLATETDGRKKK
jgi:hypothetical protein